MLATLNLGYSSCVFTLCERLISGSYKCCIELVNNPTFPVHPVFIYSLLTLYASFSEWQKNHSFASALSLKPEGGAEGSLLRILSRLSSLIAKSQSCHSGYSFCGSGEDQGNLGYFEWISNSEQRRRTFIKVYSRSTEGFN